MLNTNHQRTQPRHRPPGAPYGARQRPPASMGRACKRTVEAARNISESSQCTLSTLLAPARIFFFAMIAPNPLLKHWLEHYAGLGVDFARRSRIFLHSGASRPLDVSAAL